MGAKAITYRTLCRIMAMLLVLPVPAFPESCDVSEHREAAPPQDSGEPATYDAVQARDVQEAAFTEEILPLIPFETPGDPLDDPGWGPNDTMRGILYDEDGNELGRVGMESSKHKREREERERREREERERRERQERERREREERERREREEKERREQERREREERERQEREERRRLEEERREEERQRRLREEEERRAQQQRQLTPEEQELAAANSRGFQELRERQREDKALEKLQEESSRYGRSSGNAPGWSGSNHPAATVGEEMVEEVGGGVVPVGAVNAAGEITRMGPNIRARNKAIEELSD